MVEAEMQTAASCSAKDIQEARRSISALVLKLVAEGKIEIGPQE
jgi:flagellar motor switch protein FliG